MPASVETVVKKVMLDPSKGTDRVVVLCEKERNKTWSEASVTNKELMWGPMPELYLGGNVETRTVMRQP